ncbi:MAG TPA: LLM class F420-dependent oxidoreductase, partial [Acidimicrobiales bacterium]|nr:LLM class F420-dependent oxidoreductase [Acidimicrobiales bacterium]
MKLSMAVGYAGGFKESADQVASLEKAGLDIAWVAEAYGFDAPSYMGYLAAVTSTVQIGSGILPIYTRSPALLAQTAAGVDALSEGRCILGLGASGPQVIEGFHGVKYDKPLARTREVIDICRMAWRRERLEYAGKTITLPLPPDEGTGLGKPLKMLTTPVRDRIPIYVAALGAKNVEMTAEVADGWLPIFYIPERAANVWGEALAKGKANRAADL